MTRAPLLIEIGCEEIPARMIGEASRQLGRGLVEILDKAGLSHGEERIFGGPRRLAVRVEDVEPRQEDRVEQVLGPPAKVAFDGDGQPTRAAAGFASKQGIDVGELKSIETERGPYSGFVRDVAGQHVGQVLAQALPAAVASMWFPKTMRWAGGDWRWVRPVHWVVALHGAQILDLELFGIKSGGRSAGHRFKSSTPVAIEHPDRYLDALETSFVLADPVERRRRVELELERAAASLSGTLVPDAGLLVEVTDLVEWPGVVVGRFDAQHLDLPRELLVTTLRHHQKCFSLQSSNGDLLPAFLALANTDEDPKGHVRRGNEWVVHGRLEDARFFWAEDRKRALTSRAGDLERVVFHAKVGSYADKARRMERLAGRLAQALELAEAEVAHCRDAARYSKIDLVTGTVGEFPELQGQAGGLLLRAEGQRSEIVDGVYSHYRPSGPDDPIPESVAGCIVSVADKLDSTAELIRAGETPTGSRDPLGLRRASSGIFRILIERRWSLSLEDLHRLSGEYPGVPQFLRERLVNYLREAGSTSHEISAVLRPAISETEFLGWPLADVALRLEAIAEVRERPDFVRLVELTKRVDNILSKDNPVARSAAEPAEDQAFEEPEAAAVRLDGLIDEYAKRIEAAARDKRYPEIVNLLAELVDPVDRFFTDVLVLDPENLPATRHRWKLLERLRGVLTGNFDIRELAGQAERRS